MFKKVAIYLTCALLILGAISLVMSIKLGFAESLRITVGTLFLLFIPGFVWSFVFFPNNKNYIIASEKKHITKMQTILMKFQFDRIFKNSDILIFVAIASLGIILGLGLMQIGSFYSFDGATYFEYMKRFVNFSFNLDKPNFPSSYPLFAFPLVWLLHKIGADIAYAFRLVNIICFGLTGAGIYYITKAFTGKSIGAIAGMLYLLTTPAIPIAIDLWPQNIAIFAGTWIILTSFLFIKNNQWRWLVLNALASVSLIYVRAFEIIFYLPFFILILFNFIATFVKNNQDQKKDFKRIITQAGSWIIIVLMLLIPLLFYNQLK